ncbi:MAG: aminotransferase class I/II-fold pyridoxal phosphate-dependent enzyme [Gammaproteobacteria bacterium]|nr:aminotransferase class I/II-fold pyridoxal phosphate-dependent enzyme [Gammaproteobacteria bacterium]
MKKETRVNHPPDVPLPPDNHPLTFPIYQNVKWEYETVDETLRGIRGEREGYFYSRVSNPTVRQLEMLLAELQQRDECVVCASGVNAIAQTLIALTRSDDHIIFFIESYSPTREIIKSLLGRFGVRSTMLSIEDLSRLECVLKDTPTRLLIFESPTNPVTKIADIPAITALAKKYGALTVLDNTFAGFHQHGQFDIDVFIHSLTKYAAGTGDVMGGAVMGNKSVMQTISAQFRMLGAAIDPHAAFLLMRGLKTYFVRYRAQCISAQAVAEMLAAHPACENVRYPGLSSSRFYTLAKAQMSEFGTVVTFDIKGGAEAGRRFAESLNLFAKAASLGSTESLVFAPQLIKSTGFSTEQLLWSDISAGIVRLSIGLEDVQDLFEDLSQALKHC